MELTETDLTAIVAFRHDLHRNPELSGQERHTAGRVTAFLAPTQPDCVVTGLGGHGVAIIYGGDVAGPTVLIRCELDALPITELSGVAYRSGIAGKSHMCGHDGHMAIVASLGLQLGRRRPARGRVVLLFQPAEETGAGAAGVVADPAFSRIAPDLAFALHNLPGIALGEALLREGVVNCASRGMRIILTGRTAHASLPETGVSPVPAVGQLVAQLAALGGGQVDDDDFAMATVTHVRVGEPTFGVAPGEAEIRVTLRTRRDDRMAHLVAAAESMAGQAAARHGLSIDIDSHDVFAASVNAAEAVRHLRQALDQDGVPHGEAGLPLRASEDFGVFGRGAASAMFFLGAGEEHPALHNPDYDFPDALISTGSRVFMRVIRNLLG